MNQSPPRMCIYCGQKVGRVKRGEHVIPEAIGGSVRIKTVCHPCNNQFSVIDTELCSRSPLSLVASQVLDDQIWQVWDVDHASGNLLLEAQPDWSNKCLRQYPQVVFAPTGPRVYGDYRAMRQFGVEDYRKVLIKSMLKAFHHAEAGESRWLHLERIELTQAISQSCRFPPRVFAKNTIWELARRLARNERASFFLRFQSQSDRRQAMNSLDNWGVAAIGFRGVQVRRGSNFPTFHWHYDAAKTLRALAQIAINVLARQCDRTPVNRDAFRDVIRIVRGETRVHPALLRENGFVWPCDIQTIAEPGGGHSFRFIHIHGNWLVYFSFFGGRVAAFLRFPGPSNEDWNQMDVRSPIRSAQWDVATAKLFQPLAVRIEWQDLTKIAPSVGMFHVSSNLRANYLRRRGRSSNQRLAGRPQKVNSGGTLACGGGGVLQSPG